MDGSPDKVLVYDIGGSHISAGLCLLQDLSLSKVAKAPISAVTTSEGFLNILFDLSEQVNLASEPVAGASLAFPGPFDYESGISQMRHKLESLYGVDLRSALAERLGLNAATVRFLNDADAFVLGEVGAGAGVGFSRVIGITLGTGIGSGFAIDGDLVTEGEGVPPGGEIWNFPYAGGIVEDLLSTHSLQRDYEARTGKRVAVLEIANSAPGDQDAAEVFITFGTSLGKAIRDTMTAFRPEVVVLGGGISHSADLFLPVAQSFVEDRKIRLVTSALWDNAPLVGAGALWRKRAHA